MFGRPPEGGLLSSCDGGGLDGREVLGRIPALDRTRAPFACATSVALGGAALCKDALLLRRGRGACCFLDEALGIRARHDKRAARFAQALVYQVHLA